MSVLAVTGLIREAEIAEGDDVITVSGGGNIRILEERLESILTPDVRGIVSFGIAGALSPKLKAGDALIATSVIHAGDTFPVDTRWAETMLARVPHAQLAVIAGTNEILARPAAKEALQRQTGAAAADMESHIAACFARDRGLPFAAFRVISDAAHHGLPPAAQVALSPSGEIRLSAVLKSVAQKPSQIPALIRTGRDSNRAFSELFRGRDLLGVRLGLMDLV